MQPTARNLQIPLRSSLSYYTRSGLWSLFLICAFPIHLWTIILALRDFSWVAERTNTWDAVGEVSYGLVFAFLESAVIFLAVALLGFLIPRRWDGRRRIALLSVLVLVAACWAMAGQLYFLWNLSLPQQAVLLLSRSSHLLRVLYALALALVTPTVVVPAWLVLHSEHFLRFVNGLAERLALLASLYLVFDAIGLLVILVRNLG
jgi:hypothetical protein